MLHWYLTIRTPATSAVWGRHYWGPIRPGLGGWNYPCLSLVHTPGLLWFRVFGWGLHYSNTTRLDPSLIGGTHERRTLTWGPRRLRALWPRALGGT